jgi:phosphopantothenoylcysteine synthetase/decarboxylase
MSTPATKRFLVTAGNTRERIDSVRDWGNIFTGNTGLAIARALSRLGEVDLLTSNRAHLAELSSAADAGRPTGGRIHALPFTSHAELKGALAALLARNEYAGVFMTAAVADYQPAGVYEIVERRPDGPEAAGGGERRETWLVRDVQAAKVKSTHAAIAVVGVRTEKLVDLFRSAWGYQGLLVKFKLEVGITREELLRAGEASRAASGADYLVANTLDMVEGPDAGAFLIAPAGHEWVPRVALPDRLATVAERRG